jgi:hypothetical protein
MGWLTGCGPATAAVASAEAIGLIWSRHIYDGNIWQQQQQQQQLFVAASIIYLPPEVVAADMRSAEDVQQKEMADNAFTAVVVVTQC